MFGLGAVPAPMAAGHACTAWSSTCTPTRSMARPRVSARAVGDSGPPLTYLTEPDVVSPDNWQTEASLRMVMNNLHPDVATNPQELVVYGGIGRAACSSPSSATPR